VKTKVGKYRIRYFFDYGTFPLWAGNQAAYAKFDVGPIDPKKLNLSEETLALIERLVKWQYHEIDWENAPEIAWCDDERQQFNDEARTLFALIQRELGEDFELVYQVNG
jgi:hypothetical protein